MKKLRVELPSWADQFHLPEEQSIVEEQSKLQHRLDELSKARTALQRFKQVLIGDSEKLVEEVVHLLLVAEVERMRRRVIMWNVGTLIAMASLVFAIIRFTGGSGS